MKLFFTRLGKRERHVLDGITSLEVREARVLKTSTYSKVLVSKKLRIVLKVYKDKSMAHKVLKKYRYLERRRLDKFFVKMYGLVEIDNEWIIVMDYLGISSSSESLKSMYDMDQKKCIRMISKAIRATNSSGFFHGDLDHFGNWFVYEGMPVFIDIDRSQIVRFNVFKRVYFSVEDRIGICLAFLIIFGKNKGFRYAKQLILRYSLFSFIWWPLVAESLKRWLISQRFFKIED